MNPDPYRYFRVEARELVDALGKGALALERTAPLPAQIAHLLRLAHTLKGAARVVKQREIADHAHALEDLLTPHRDSGGPVARAGVDEVLGLIDRMGERVSALAGPAATDVVAGAPEPLARPAEEPLRTVRAEVAEVDLLLDGIAGIQVQLAQLASGVGQIERIGRLVGALADAPAEGGADARPGPRSGDAAEALAACRGLDRALGGRVEQMERQLGEVRRSVERLRLVPADALFTPLERAARDAAGAQGKQVRFEATGGDLRLDADVLSTVQGALLQAVRNAVAHGIEREEERRALGKPPAGLVRIEVARRGRRVAFICRDDGRGIDFEAVDRVARGKGLVPQDGRSTHTGLIEKLLSGGISTAATVSEVAGRGVGLDVVREAVARLGGEVHVSTEPGRGTSIELDVPLSLASLEAIEVEAGGVVVAIPLDAVRSSIRLAHDRVSRSPNGEAIVHLGHVVPFLPLARVLSGASLAGARGQVHPALLIAGAGGTAAIGVDRILGTGLIVLRPLPELCPAAPLLAGATLDAEGSPRLVLDPDGLIAAARSAQPEPAAAEVVRSPILVIDDSLTTRMLEQSILESAGYKVVVAVSAEDALERARRERFSLFLVDVEMPGMDGFSFVATVQADPALRQTPSILVTSRNGADDRLRGEQVGARGYIVKGEFDQAELLQRIRALVGA
ncbi:MAG TPA: response regulator [Kofleriaceae bacterium]|nr:response regulator [Kofleriaceae bacterium]